MSTYDWIKREEAAGNIYPEVDGFYVWTPAANGGSLNEHALIEMAQYLHARNAYWQWQIDHDPAIGGRSA
jgi:hypothetical protein